MLHETTPDMIYGIYYHNQHVDRLQLINPAGLWNVERVCKQSNVQSVKQTSNGRQTVCMCVYVDFFTTAEPASVPQESLQEL